MYRLLHQWVGLASSAVLVVLAISGFFLIHPGLLGGPMESTLALAVNPNDADHMLRGTLSGLYRSVDGGANWEEVPMLFHAEKVTDIVYAPDDADRVYVVMEDLGLIVSRDGGVVWESVQLGFVPVAEGVRLGRLTAGRGGRIVLATSGGWLKSGDGAKCGARWAMRQNLAGICARLYISYTLAISLGAVSTSCTMQPHSGRYCWPLRGW